MRQKCGLITAILSLLIVFAWAHDDHGSQEMIEQGKIQYQLMQERSNLPQYGPCWKSAVIHVEGSCKNLSEEIQSDIALRITNCFLAMSGHETYNCEQDKKPNLRGICINNMSNRAFNVYTQFYTHTQNICWFLKEQMWHDAFLENTLKLIKKLELANEKQEQLLVSQRDGMETLEQTFRYMDSLSVWIDILFESAQKHLGFLNELAYVETQLNDWLIAGISLFESVLYYVQTIFLSIIFTSIKITSGKRIQLLILILLNFLFERWYWFVYDSNKLIDMYSVVWIVRIFFSTLAALIIIVAVRSSKNLPLSNLNELEHIYEENGDIIEMLNKFKKRNDTDTVIDSENSETKENDPYVIIKQNNAEKTQLASPHKSPLSEISNTGYNLRSRSATPV